MAEKNEYNKQKNAKLNKDTVKKLEEVFAIDGSVEEACYYANVSRQSFYTWIKDDPKLKKNLDRLRNRPVLKARQTVNKGIGESYQNAMDYLKRKKKLEFGDTNKIELETVDVTKKEKKTVGDVIGKFLNK